MDWLAGWLKTVIMVIMLATFVDLLLPSNTMQRYVKTVLSLFILLTLLTPVLQLFQKDWDMDQLLSQAEKEQNEKTMLAGGFGGNQTQMKSLAAITKDANKIQDAEQKKTQELVQTQLAALIKEDLQKQTEWPVQEVKVYVEVDNNGKPSITNVKVTLDDIETKKQTTTKSNSIAAMEPVKPVDPIKIGSTATAQDRQTSAQGDLHSTLKALPSEQEKDRLKQDISRNWLVDPAKIEIETIQSKGWMAR